MHIALTQEDLAVFLSSLSLLLGTLYTPICHGDRGAELGGEGFGRVGSVYVVLKTSYVAEAANTPNRLSEEHSQDRYVLYKLPLAKSGPSRCQL